MPNAALLTNYQNFLTELMISRQVTFPMEYPFLAELSGSLAAGGIDPGYHRYTRGMAELGGDRDTFHGKKVTIPLQLNDVPGAAGVSEGGTFPGAAPIDTNQATLNLKTLVQPIALTLELERDARNGSTSAMDAVAMYTESAYRQLARVENDMLHGGGDGLICNVASATGTGTLVVDVGTTNVPWDQLTPGRVVNIATRSTGATTTNGKRRKIASVQRSAGTVTFATAAVASDGESGNITFAATSGIYLDSVETDVRSQALQGLGQATANTTTFEGIDQSTVQQWAAVVGSPSASAILSDEILDNTTYLLRGNGVPASDFGVAHPKVIDAYKQSKTSQVHYEKTETTLKSGFKGISYEGADKPFPLIKDLSAPRSTCRLIYKEAVQLYGDDVGPAFIDDDGSTFRFFTRSTVKEADLLDRVQFGVKDCGKLATIASLTEAS